MKPSSVRKVFGIISYFPNNDSAYHIETRKERSRRFRELLFKLEELWSDVDIMIIAQNWQDFEIPQIKNKTKVFHFGKLGILKARKELRNRFLQSDYDYLIMLDDDAIISAENPNLYMSEIDNHPDGMGVIRHENSPLNLLAISKTIYTEIDMPNVDPEKGDGFEDNIFVATCFAKFPEKCFDFPSECVSETSFHYNGPGKCPSTWSKERKYDWEYMRNFTKQEVSRLYATKGQTQRKVFGIISYFPDETTEYYKTMKWERRRRCSELLEKLGELWPTVDIMFVAQNWGDYQPPEIPNKITVLRHNDRLGIIGARKELRTQFLSSDYDYMIMVDDDARIKCDNPQAYLDAIDKHPNGFAAIHGYEHGPMNFMAISKYIYNQVDVPSINPENGEGFEDDVFFATCIQKFPDNQFHIPKDLIFENSLQYHGIGECPSTWSEERKYDWKGMRNYTDAKLYAIQNATENRISEEIVDPTIDVIITYVNCSDQVWRLSYVRTTHLHNTSTARFRSWGTLKYLLRGIDRYMPFVRNVVLVVACPTQVPAWLNTNKVRVVYHQDFIPKEFLPTFNSCTIESFLWKIPGLADRVIYLNDDVFPTSFMKETDFFTDKTPHITFTEPTTYTSQQLFRSQCRAGMDLITKVLELPAFEFGKIIRPEHTATALNYADMQKVGKLCEPYIANTISTLRVAKNVNQYIYTYFEYFTDNYLPSEISHQYREITDGTIDDTIKEFLSGKYQMVCINDSEKSKNCNIIQNKLQRGFTIKFPDKCKYEL